MIDLQVTLTKNAAIMIQEFLEWEIKARQENDLPCPDLIAVYTQIDTTLGATNANP